LKAPERFFPPFEVVILALPLIGLMENDRGGMFRDQGAIMRGARREKRIALEFTGDRYAEGGPTILNALKSRRARASFFLTRRFLRKLEFRKLIERIRDEGRYLGPHGDQHLRHESWDRPSKLLVTEVEFTTDFRANLREIDRFGVTPEDVCYFLPPFEHYTEEIVLWSAGEGSTLIIYTSGTRSHTDYMTDDDPRFVPASELIDSILKAERTDPDGLNDYLLLMHLGAGPGRTLDHPYERIGGLLDALKARGYVFVRIDELLAAAR